MVTIARHRFQFLPAVGEPSDTYMCSTTVDAISHSAWKKLSFLSYKLRREGNKNCVIPLWNNTKLMKQQNVVHHASLHGLALEVIYNLFILRPRFRPKEQSKNVHRRDNTRNSIFAPVTNRWARMTLPVRKKPHLCMVTSAAQNHRSRQHWWTPWYFGKKLVDNVQLWMPLLSKRNNEVYVGVSYNFIFYVRKGLQ